MSHAGNVRTNDQNDHRKTIPWTNILAILAILISAINFYYTFFWKEYELKAAILEFNHYQDSTFVADVVFSNSGNQYAIVSDAFLFLPSENVKGGIISVGSIINSVGDTLFNPGYTVIDWRLAKDGKHTLPIILSPGQMVKKRIIFSYGYLNLTFIKRGLPEQSEFSINAQIRFKAIDSMGEVHEGSKSLTLDIVNGRVSGVGYGSPTIITLIR